MSIDLGELRGLLTLTDNFSGPGKAFRQVADDIGAVFGVVAAAAAAATAAFALAAIAVKELGERGADVNDVEEHFRSLSAAAGISADVMLGKLQEGTLGTVKNFDLMVQSNKLLGSGLVKSADDMGTLAAGAKLLADRTGGDTKEAFDKLSDAMAKGKAKGLEQLGLFVDSAAALKKYADSIGTTVPLLSEHEKRAAVNAATLAEMKSQLDAAGKASADFGDIIKRGKTDLDNFKDALSKSVASSPVVMAGMDGVASAIRRAFGADQDKLIHTIMLGINEFAIKTVQGARLVVEGAIMIRQGWDLVATAFAATGVVIVGSIANMVTGIGVTLQAFSYLPGSIPGLRAVGAEFIAFGDSVTNTAAGLVQSAKTHAAATLEENATMRELARSLVDTVQNMKAAQDTYKEAAVTAGVTKKGLEDLGGAALRSAQADEDAAKRWVKAEKEKSKAYVDLIKTVTDADNQIKAKATELQDQLNLINATGLQKRLLEIQLSRDKELASIDRLKVGSAEKYAALVALVNQKYNEMSAKAADTYDKIAISAEAGGFRQRTAAEQVAIDAKIRYEQMLADGSASYAALAKAREDAAEREKEAKRSQGEYEMTANQAMVASAQLVLGAFAAKHKTAAIAMAIMDTYAAAAKALASAPPPYGAILMAATIALGLVQVNKIRQQDSGWSQGTPGTGYQDFGAGSMEMLHGSEAVITQAQGASLAGQIGDEIRAARGSGGSGDSALVALLVGLRRDMRALPYHLAKATRDAMQTAPTW